MRKARWILAGAVVLALAATPALAAGYAAWDWYNHGADYGFCLMVEDDGDVWLIRFQDNPNSDQRYRFDIGQDRILNRHKLPTRLGP